MMQRTASKFYGFHRKSSALEESQRTNPTPDARRMSNGAWVAVGPVEITPSGAEDVRLYGLKSASLWLTEATALGLFAPRKPRVYKNCRSTVTGRTEFTVETRGCTWSHAMYSHFRQHTPRPCALNSMLVCGQ